MAGGEGLPLSVVCEHDTIDAGSKLITLHFLWFIDTEFTELKIWNCLVKAIVLSLLSWTELGGCVAYE